MNLEKKYELLDVVRDDGIRTMKAREVASGRALEVHLFMKREDHALFEQLQGLPLSGRSALLEFGSELKIPYVVTDPVAGETDARGWFTSLLRPVGKVAEVKAQEVKAQEVKAQEVKALEIKAAVWKTGTPLPDPLFPGEVQAGKVKVDEPGEFTRMFQAPAAVEIEAGEEKTRMFQVPPAAAAAASPVKEAGEFTRLFESMQQSPAAAAEPVKASGPGEFTRMFQSPLSPGAPAAIPVPATPQPPQNRAGEFTQLFGMPSAGGSVKPGQSATGAFAVAQEPAKQHRIPAIEGPGQFTRMMSAGSAPTLGQEPRGEQSSPVAGKNSKAMLFVILGALAGFAVLIVLFFALRR